MQNANYAGVSLKQIRAFVAVARLGSFTRAAERIGLSQPALTMTIRQLEEEIGITLFDRTTRRVTLTTDGREFLPTAERLLADLDLAIEDLRAVAERRRGRIGVAAVYSVASRLLPDLVASFTRAYPGIRVHLRDGNSSSVCRAVRSHEVDFGFACGEIDTAEFTTELLFRDRMGVVARREHPLMKLNRPLTWRDLTQHDFLYLSRDTGLWPIFRAYVGECSAAGRRFEVSGNTMLQAALGAGLGVTAVPALVAPDRDNRDLEFRPLHRPAVMREMFLVTRKGRSLSSAAEAMRALVIEGVRALPQQYPLVESLV